MYGEEALEESKTAVCFLSVFIRGGITMNTNIAELIIAKMNMKLEEVIK